MILINLIRNSITTGAPLDQEVVANPMEPSNLMDGATKRVWHFQIINLMMASSGTMSLAIIDEFQCVKIYPFQILTLYETRTPMFESHKMYNGKSNPKSNPKFKNNSNSNNMVSSGVTMLESRINYLLRYNANQFYLKCINCVIVIYTLDYCTYHY